MLRALYLWWRRRQTYGRALRAPSRLVVLRFHSVGLPERVGEYYDPALSLTPERFDAHVALLARRYDVVGLDAILRDGDRTGCGPAPPARRPRCVITFDDGLRDNLDHALPVLHRHGATATFFVTTAPLLGTRTFWISELWRLARNLPDGALDLAPPAPALVPAAAAGRERFRRAMTRYLSGLPDGEREPVLDVLSDRAGVPRGQGLAGTFLDGADLRALEAAGMTIGAHSRTHPHLDRLAARHLDDEVAGSRADLEALLGHTIRHFAYPNPSGGGVVSDAASSAVQRAGFACAVTSLPGPVARETSPYRLPRLGVYAGRQEKLLFRMLAAAGA